MRIAIGTDHRGFEHKDFIIKNFHVEGCDVQWIDVGAFNAERSDYPEFARLVVEKMLNGSADLGVLLCGSGIGMAIAANRFSGIYAGLVWNDNLARLAREDDNVNLLVLPADFISHQQAVTIIQCWLAAEFKGGRHAKRLEMVDQFIK